MKKQDVIAKVLEGQVAMVTMPATEEEPEHVLYLQARKTSGKPQFYKSFDTAQWTPESSFPAREVVYGVWHLLGA